MSRSEGRPPRSHSLDAPPDGPREMSGSCIFICSNKNDMESLPHPVPLHTGIHPRWKILAPGPLQLSSYHCVIRWSCLAESWRRYGHHFVIMNVSSIFRREMQMITLHGKETNLSGETELSRTSLAIPLHLLISHRFQWQRTSQLLLDESSTQKWEYWHFETETQLVDLCQSRFHLNIQSFDSRVRAVWLLDGTEKSKYMQMNNCQKMIRKFQRSPILIRKLVCSSAHFWSGTVHEPWPDGESKLISISKTKVPQYPDWMRNPVIETLLFNSFQSWLRFRYNLLYLCLKERELS
jgi:hypothetical protein